MGTRPRTMALTMLLGAAAAAVMVFYGVRDLNPDGPAAVLTIALEIVLPAIVGAYFLWRGVSYWRHDRRAV